MKTIAEAATEIAAAQRPVLCLDTCVLLDVITLGNRGQADQIGLNRRLLDVVVTTPERVQLVVNDLIDWEWNQRRDDVKNEAMTWLVETDKQIAQIHRAREELLKPLPFEAKTYTDPQLIDDLAALGQAILGQALVLKQDTDCVLKAIERVKKKQRPSHNKQVKDSIHLETYLQFSRQLRDKGHTAGRFFLSTNASDFWHETYGAKGAHSELANDMNDAGLTFLGRLPIVMKALGILR
ncbi:MAG: hypothetical protein JWO38_5033 [Gemmataceae bacterium]|nr:hypothetical protein [Gemmataceae bacterium]